jgi:hypothetical protein
VETENLSIGVKEFGGRRDQQGPVAEEGKFERVTVVERDTVSIKTVLRSSRVSQYDLEVQ